MTGALSSGYSTTVVAPALVLFASLSTATTYTVLSLFAVMLADSSAQLHVLSVAMVALCQLVVSNALNVGMVPVEDTAT